MFGTKAYNKKFITYYDSNYTSLVSRKCKCGHTVTIYNRYRRQTCRWCGRMVFLTKKDEFNYNMKRMGVI